MESGQLYRLAKQKISQRIGGEWKHLARAFAFQETNIAAIQHSSRNDLHEEIHQMFVKWECQGHGARCVHELVNALRKAAQDTRKQLLSDIAGELLKSIIDSQFVEKTRDRWRDIAEVVGFTPTEIHECAQVDPNDRRAQSNAFLDKWCRKEGWNMLLQLPTALKEASFSDRAEKFAQGVYGMSLASFVSWRDSLPGQVHHQSFPAVEEGSLVAVMCSGLWLYGVVKEVKRDTHPEVAAVEMEENYDCLRERLNDGIAHFPVQDLQLDTDFLQRHESIESPEEPLALMGLQLDDDPPQWVWPQPLSPAFSPTSSPRTRSAGAVRTPDREQSEGTNVTMSFDSYSDHSSDTKVQEAGALQLIPVSPVEENHTIVLMIPGDRTGLLIGAGGKTRKRIEEETSAKIKIDRSPLAHISVDATVTIRGSKKQCSEAEQQVLSVIQNKADKNMEYTKIITVSADLADMIAVCCDDIQQESKAIVEVKQANDEWQCRVTGTHSEVEHAEGLVMHALLLDYSY